MTLQEVDKKISELHILRKSLEKMEIRKFQEKAKKNVGRCFILNGNYLRIIDIPREESFFSSFSTEFSLKMSLSPVFMRCAVKFIFSFIAFIYYNGNFL